MARAGSRICSRPRVRRQHPLGAFGEQVDANVGGDPVEPRAQFPFLFEAREAAPNAKQGLLKRVLGVVQRTEHPVAMRMQAGAIGLDELAEGALVSVAGRSDEFLRTGRY